MTRELHDRCIVDQHGQVLWLGTSITGIGRHLTTIIPMPAPASAGMRASVERLWAEGTVIKPQALRRD